MKKCIFFFLLFLVFLTGCSFPSNREEPPPVKGQGLYQAGNMLLDANYNGRTGTYKGDQMWLDAWRLAGVLENGKRVVIHFNNANRDWDYYLTPGKTYSLKGVDGVLDIQVEQYHLEEDKVALSYHYRLNK